MRDRLIVALFLLLSVLGGMVLAQVRVVTIARACSAPHSWRVTLHRGDPSLTGSSPGLYEMKSYSVLSLLTRGPAEHRLRAIPAAL
jgi:hypothetical protein